MIVKEYTITIRVEAMTNDDFPSINGLINGLNATVRELDRLRTHVGLKPWTNAMGINPDNTIDASGLAPEPPGDPPEATP